MIATIISIIALITAVFSFFVTAEKFRLDLYNKRFDIYVRTVRFYQGLMSRSESEEAQATFETLRKEFILATRESQFLFSPESGVPRLLIQLNADSFVITGQRDMPKGLPPEQIIANQDKFATALMRWNDSMEPLEAMIAPYLNYHYASPPAAMAGWCRAAAGRLRKLAGRTGTRSADV